MLAQTWNIGGKTLDTIHFKQTQYKGNTKTTIGSQEAIREILYAGSLAPSSRTPPALEFIIVVSEETKREYLLKSHGPGPLREKEGGMPAS